MGPDQPDSETPLILIPGMGADASMFAPQLVAFPHLLAVDWPVPLYREDFPDYAKRFAKTIDPGCPCFVGGASFGGIMALEITKHLNVKGFLIGSIPNSNCLPKRIKFLKPFKPLIDFIPLSLLQKIVHFSTHQRWIMGYKLSSIMKQFAGADRDVLRWSMKQILMWNSVSNDVPIYHIHGNRDPVFPIRHLQPDETISGGGHVISISHPKAVNAFLRRYLK